MYDTIVDWKTLVAKRLRSYDCPDFRAYRRRARFHRTFSKSSFRGELMVYVSLTDFSFKERSAGFHEGFAARRGISLLIDLLLRLVSNIPQRSHQISFLRDPVFRECSIVDSSHKVTGNYLSTPLLVRLLSSIPICAHRLFFIFRMFVVLLQNFERDDDWDKSNIVENVFDRYFCFYDFDFLERIILKVFLNNNNILKSEPIRLKRLMFICCTHI